MVPNNFTTRSREAIERAYALTASGRNPELHPLHLLGALLEHKDGVVISILKKIGIDAAATAAANAEALKKLPTGGQDADTLQLVVSPVTLKVFRQAESEASRFGDEYISTEHLL